jgi:hypothetical protein
MTYKVHDMVHDIHTAGQLHGRHTAGQLRYSQALAAQAETQGERLRESIAAPHYRSDSQNLS